MNLRETGERILSAIYDEENLAEARRICETFLDRQDSPFIWRLYGDILLKGGMEFAARAIYRNILPQLPNLHIKDIILARVDYCRPMIDDKHKIIYYNIPKCGSSTIKDYFAFLLEGQIYGDTSHSNMARLGRIVSFDEIRTKYEDYFTFTVIRYPIVRLRAYYQKNVVEAKSLYLEVDGKDSFLGLPTRPEYDDMIANFARYREVFHDFRHHTDPITGYVGSDVRNVKKIYRMEQMEEVRQRFCELAQADIPQIHNMKNELEYLDARAITARELEIESEFYGEEVTRFFSSYE